MCDDWTKCEQCQFFDFDKCYCNRMLRTVTIGCPYGEDEVTMVVAERGAGRKAYTDSVKLSFLIGELKSLYLILGRSIDAIDDLEKCTLSKDAFVTLSAGMKEGYKEVHKYIECILKEIE